MAAAGVMQQSLSGTRISQRRPSTAQSIGRRGAVSTVAMARRKVNTLDEAWKKGVGSVGYFSEHFEKAPPNLLRSIESKKLLSTAGKFKLLSSADKAGLNLAKLEELKLLSTAEKLGLFSTMERALTSDPGAISSISIPFLIAAAASLVFIPTDNLATSIAHWGAFLTFLTGFTVFFVGGFVVAAVQDES